MHISKMHFMVAYLKNDLNDLLQYFTVELWNIFWNSFNTIAAYTWVPEKKFITTFSNIENIQYTKSIQACVNK
jgi:hypothetical protein